MLRTGIYLQVIILGMLIIFACKRKDEIDVEYYPYPNKMDTIIHDGLNRSYLLHVPTSYSADNKTPLVIALHGYTSSATDFENGSRLSEKADAEGFIVAYPNGLKYPWTASNPQAWNAGGQYEGWTQGTDDVGFIDQMIEQICKYYTIDRNRIYVTGHSNGSFMSYRLGYELSCKIAAIATHSGAMVYQPNTAPLCKISILHLHALNDPSAKYNGSPSPDFTYPAVDIMLSHWVSWFSCNIEPDTIFQNTDYLIKTWNCSGNTIESYVLNKGEHNWFTSSNSGVQANDVIWDFFKEHPKSME